MSGTAIWDALLGSSPATWTLAFGSELNSLAAGYYGLSSVIIAPAQLTDLTISVALGSVAPSASGASLAFYWQPLNQDGTSYGDGTPSGSVVPVQNYIGSIAWPTSATASALTGFLQVERIVPATSFKLGVVNLLGSALAASGNTIQIALNKINLNG